MQKNGNHYYQCNVRNSKKFELVCNGPTDDNDFEQAFDDFERECKITRFWRQRNISVEYANGSDDDDESEISFRFNIKKVSFM
jgi:hypothetical protein